MSINKFYVYTLALATFFILPSLAKAAVNIDACGFLNQAGETYILTQDVSSPGTCFSIGANNITLDLNGHTITYNTSAGDLRHGIAIPSSSLQRRIYFPDSTIPDAAFVGADNIVIKNGTLVQGAGQGSNSNAIFGWGTSNTEVANTHTTVYGGDIANIMFEYSNNLSIHDNTAISHSTVVSNRHQGKEVIGSLGDGGNTNVYNNTITGGPQFGIRVAGDGAYGPYEIYNNNISQNTTVVNGYSISASGDGSLIHDNIINPTNGRGIHIPGTDSIQIYNNTITVKEGPNPELSIGFSHGIKMENATNARVYNNNVTALAGVDGSGHAYALDISQSSRLPGNNEVYDNTFTAITANSNRVAATVHLVGVSAGNNLNIHDNTFYTNDYAVYFDYDSGSDLVLKSNTFQLTGTPFTPQLVYFYTGSQASLNNIFLDNILGSGLSYDDVGYRAAGANFSLHIQEYLNITVRNSQSSPIAGASISVRDDNNNLVASGVSDSSGNLTLAITIDTHSGKPYQHTSFDSHSITVSASGYNTNTVSVDVSQTQDVVINMTAGDSSEPPACIASWSCSEWSACANGTQSRTCTDVNSCGDNSSRPALSQSCSVDNGGGENQCIPNWSCTAWSSCSSSSQTRTCTDVNSCGDNSSRPALSQSCSVSTTPGGGGGGGGGTTTGNDTGRNPNQSADDLPAGPNNSTLACKTCSYNRGSLLVLENASGSAVYHIGKDGRKYVFPDAKTYFTWNRDFSKVLRVSLSVLDDYPDGGVVAYRGGTKLITHQNTARVYAVEPGGIIRWIPSEEIAKKLFGPNWAKMVQDVIPGFFATSYTLGENLSDRLPTGSLVKYNNLYYYIDGNLKRKFSSLSVLESNGFKVEDVMEVNDLSAYGNGSDISGFDEEIASYL